MGIAGSVTSAVSSTSVTLPASNMNIIGATVYAHTVSGYLTIQVDSTRTALIPFESAIDVTTLKVPNTHVLPRAGIRAFNFQTTGSTLLYTGTGLTSGTFVFYYGTPFKDSVPLANFTAITVSFTTGTSLAFTFPAGPIKLTGAALVFGSNTAQTTLQITDTWNTGTGRTLLLAFSQATTSEIIPLDDVDAAQTLTVTQAYSGTHVGTGYLFIYYKLA